MGMVDIIKDEVMKLEKKRHSMVIVKSPQMTEFDQWKNPLSRSLHSVSRERKKQYICLSSGFLDVFSHCVISTICKGISLLYNGKFLAAN